MNKITITETQFRQLQILAEDRAILAAILNDVQYEDIDINRDMIIQLADGSYEAAATFTYSVGNGQNMFTESSMATVTFDIAGPTVGRQVFNVDIIITILD